MVFADALTTDLDASSRLEIRQRHTERWGVASFSDKIKGFGEVTVVFSGKIRSFRGGNS